MNKERSVQLVPPNILFHKRIFFTEDDVNKALEAIVSK